MTGDLPARPRFAVIGAGAVGSYYGGRLAEAGADVHFLLRSDLEAIRRNGLRVRSIDGDFHLRTPAIHASTAEIGPCDVVIIALKTTANPSLLDLVPPLLHDHTVLLTLQNGLGNEEFLASHFGADRVVGGLCFVCINRISPGVIHHLAQGPISIGEFDGPARARTRSLAAHFVHSRVPCAVVDRLPAERWKKLAWNIPFNGLAIAAGGIDTAAIMRDPDLRRLATDLIRETIDAAAACDSPLPPTLVDDHLQATLTMGPYLPSSLIDFRDGRDVEVASIWGEPLRRAQEAGAEVPRLTMLHAVIQSLVRERGI